MCRLEWVGEGGNKNGSSGNNRAKRWASARHLPTDKHKIWVRRYALFTFILNQKNIKNPCKNSAFGTSCLTLNIVKNRLGTHFLRWGTHPEL